MSGRSTPRWVVAAACAVALVGTACAPGNGQGSRALYELERLAFVPASRARIPGVFSELADCSIDRPIVMDLYEFSRRDGEHYGFDGGARRDAFTTDGAIQGGGEWPLYLDFHEANELATARSMRLPTAREWLHVATGAGTQRFPWHANFQHGVSNTLDLEVGKPTPVGTFERGRSSVYGCYDMYGNVWEWVVDVVPGFGDFVSYEQVTNEIGRRDVEFVEAYRDPDTGEPIESSVLGGSYNTTWLGNPLFDFRNVEVGDQLTRLCVYYFAKRQSRTYLSPEIGARMCADAAEYLWAKAPEWGASAEDERRIRATGRRWAQVSSVEVVASFLEELAARDQAPLALGWLAEGARE